jgi:integrase
MAKAHLTPKFVREITCPADKKRMDFFDTEMVGFLLEVRDSGGKTYHVRYRNQRGTLRQVKIGTAQILNVGEARKAAQKLLAQVSLGADPTEEKAVLRAVPTFAEFVVDRYLPFVKGYKRSWKTDESLLRNHLIPRLGRMHLDQITKNDIIAIHHGRRADGATPASANRVLVLLRYILNLALKWELAGVTKNPSQGVPLFEENNKRERYLSKEEAQRLYACLLESDNTMLRFIVPMLVLTGARKRELLDARWEDIDEARQVWRIPITKTGNARHVPLSDGMVRLLHTVPRFPDCPFVVPNPKTLRPYVSIFNSWNTARKAAGMPEVRIHDLRHSFASFLINAGRSLYEVQKILGHTQIRTTQRYAHLSQETLLDAANTAVDALGVEFAPPVLALPQTDDATPNSNVVASIDT